MRTATPDVEALARRNFAKSIGIPWGDAAPDVRDSFRTQAAKQLGYVVRPPTRRRVTP